MGNLVSLPEAFRNKIVVFYDGACPGCIKDMHWYQARQRADDNNVVWFDITGQEMMLHELQIDPFAAMLELHVLNQQGQVVSEIPAYQLLLNRLPGWSWIGTLIGLPGIRPILGMLYRRWVKRRLCQAGRL
jgi:predicted DCC family thiol-disulfide oxidoreductase YuxK